MLLWPDMRSRLAGHSLAIALHAVVAVLASGGAAQAASVTSIDRQAVKRPAARPSLGQGQLVARAAAKKKSMTATVNGTFIVRQDFPGGFGADKGPNWQQLKVVIKSAKLRFVVPNHLARATVPVRFEYTAEAHTRNRGPLAGCDSEDLETYGGWSDTTTVTIHRVSRLLTKGKNKDYQGWQVTADPPKAGIYTVSRGTYEAWESILMEKCLRFEFNHPLGYWNSAFAMPVGVGKLSSDGRSVSPNTMHTEADETATVTGSVKFSGPVTAKPPRGQAASESLN